METTLNDLQRQQNDLARQALILTSQIEQLTGIRLDHFVGMTLKRAVTEGAFLPQTQQQAKVAAAAKELQQARDRHYPALKLEGFISENGGRPTTPIAPSTAATTTSASLFSPCSTAA